MPKNFFSRYARHPAFITAVAVALNVAIDFLRGWQTSLPGFVFGVASCMIGCALGINVAQRRLLPAAVQRALDRLHETSAKELARRLMRFMRAHPVISFGTPLGIAWGLAAPATSTLPTVAREIYALTSLLGAGCMVFGAVGQALVNHVDTSNHVAAPWAAPSCPVTPVVIDFVERAIILCLTLVAVRAFGVELADVVACVLRNPEGALITAAALVIVAVGLRCTSVCTHSTALLRGSKPEAIAEGEAGQRQREMSTLEIYRCAVHEAGHALVYAACDELPPRFSATVLTAVAANGERGRVQHARVPNEAPTSDDLHWFMLVLVAGAEAEYLVFGKRFDGSTRDNSIWLATASRFLSCGFGDDVFHAHPCGDARDAQVAHNRAVLKDLRERCRREVGAFLSANRHLLEDFATALAEHKTMDSAQCGVFLSRATAVDMMPRTANGGFEAK